MKQFSQKELLDEGVWDAVKTGGRLGVAALGAGSKAISKGLDYVAPELTRPIHGLEHGLKEYGREVKDRFLRLAKGKKDFIKGKLKDVGYVLNEKIPFERVEGGMILLYAYKVKDYDDNGKAILTSRSYPLVVDPNTGFITKNVTNVQNLTNKPTAAGGSKKK